MLHDCMAVCTQLRGVSELVCPDNITYLVHLVTEKGSGKGSCCHNKGPIMSVFALSVTPVASDAMLLTPTRQSRH